MTIIQKKNISTFKLYTETVQFKTILNTNNFVLFYFFQFFNNKEQLILNKILKKFNLTSKIISKKSCNSVLKNTHYKNLNKICQSNVLLIYSNNNTHNNISEAMKELIKLKKMQLIAIKIENNLYKPSIAVEFAKLSQLTQLEPLKVIVQLLNKVRTNISFIKV